MNRFIKCAIFIALAGAVSASCQKQSSLSIEDIPGKAIIKGRLIYNEGQAYENGKFVELQKPAANKTVTVKVYNQSYTSSGIMYADDQYVAGYTDFTAVTDENGYYSVEIPAVDNGVAYYIIGETFEGTYSYLKTVEKGQYVFENKTVVFMAGGYDEGIIFPGETAVVSLVYDMQFLDEIISLDETVSLNVKVALGTPRARLASDSPYDDYFGEWIPGTGVDVVIGVTYYDYPAENMTQVRYYGATSDAQGIAKFNIPAQDTEWNAQVMIEAKPFVKNNFIYYTDDTEQKTITSGVYTQYILDYDAPGPEYTEIYFTGLPEIVETRTAYMLFEPLDGVEDYGYDYWDYDWAYYDVNF